MGRLVILGAGVSGHTAAMHAKRKLGNKHEIVVVSPNKMYNWIPSNIWVGVGEMKPEQVTFELAPVYKKLGITLVPAKAHTIFPEGSTANSRPHIAVAHTYGEKTGAEELLNYDFLINATGPKLNFDATPGLGPDKGFSWSVCTSGHAAETAKELQKLILDMKSGHHKTIVIGTGHGTCTCQGAAFEYLFNVEHVLNQAGVRQKATLIWISNEHALGDFGMGSMHLKQGGFVTPGRIFAESLFAERGVEWIVGAAVKHVEAGKLRYETLDGIETELRFDFSMLLPPFSGVGLKAFDKSGADITAQLFAANGFMKVDGDYSAKTYEEWSPKDWPKTYQNPVYKNIFAVGIAFAPPHPISKPMSSKNGTPIFPTPPRTGMPSGVMGREVALNVADMMLGTQKEPVREASLANMGAACIASVGKGLFDGSAVSMTVYPIVPDFERFPETGRSLHYTTGEVGLAGHWIKHLLHHGFLYKAKALPGWQFIPE
jgi:sulfide:quinone oxidoreductase